MASSPPASVKRNSRRSFLMDAKDYAKKYFLDEDVRHAALQGGISLFLETQFCVLVLTLCFVTRPRITEASCRREFLEEFA